MIGSIFVGSLLTIVTIGIHAVGTACWISQMKRVARTSVGKRRRLLPFRLLCTTALLLILLHIVEVLPWSAAYLLAPQIPDVASFEEAMYFATVTFASLGYGDIVITGPWRMLSAIQAMNGLLVFGWSTALLFAVVERIWGRDFDAEHQRRTAPPEQGGPPDQAGLPDQPSPEPEPPATLPLRPVWIHQEDTLPRAA